MRKVLYTVSGKSSGLMASFWECNKDMSVSQTHDGFQLSINTHSPARPCDNASKWLEHLARYLGKNRWSGEAPIPYFRTDSYLNCPSVPLVWWYKAKAWCSSRSCQSLGFSLQVGRSTKINCQICCFKEQTVTQVEGNMLLLVPHTASDGVASVTAIQTVRIDPSRLAVKAWQLVVRKRFHSNKEHLGWWFFHTQGQHSQGRQIFSN